MSRHRRQRVVGVFPGVRTVWRQCVKAGLVAPAETAVRFGRTRLIDNRVIKH